ncbi:unnamed protein product [Closterium sp. NIES-54]
MQELEPLSLRFNNGRAWWNRSLVRLLKLGGHHSLDLTFSSSAVLLRFDRLLASSVHSLTSLSLGVKDPSARLESFQYLEPGRIHHISQTFNLIEPAFLVGFGQLQRLKLGRGLWFLRCVKAAWFKALRSLTIEHLESISRDHDFLSSISPQLHEFSISSCGRRCSLRLDFFVARVITVSCEQQVLAVNFSLPPNLKALSVTARRLEVNCTSASPPRLDSLTLIGRRQLDVCSLPLASAKTVYLDGPHAHVWKSELDALPLTQLLSSIAPTLETLIVRHGWPLEDVDAEWSRLRSLGIGVRGTRIGGGRDGDMATVEDAERSFDWRGFGGGTSTSSEHEGIRPPFIEAPVLQLIFFPTR